MAVIWTAAWGVIVIVDFFVLNGGRADVPALYASPCEVTLRRHSRPLDPSRRRAKSRLHVRRERPRGRG